MELELGPTMRAARRHKGPFALVVMQLATTFVILASLIVVGFWFHTVGRMSPGYDPTELIGVQVQTPRNGETVATATALPVPGPDVAAATWLCPPLRAEDGTPTIHTAGTREARGWTVYADRSVVEVLGLQIVEGALPADGGGETPAPGSTPVILTRSLRDTLFPGGAPAVGAAIASDDAPAGRVVAVVEPVMFGEAFYSNPRDIAIRLARPPTPGFASYVVRARPGRRAAAATALAAALGPSGPARVVAITSYGLVPPRFRTVVDGLGMLFMMVGLTVAVIALIGALAVSSFVVAARRRDVGIRRALGARRRDILRYFLVEASLMAALGVGLGLAVTLALLWLMRGLFLGLPIHGRYLAMVALVLWANAIGAALLPARRAARIPPSLASRGG